MTSMRAWVVAVGLLILGPAVAWGQWSEPIIPVDPAFEQGVLKEIKGELALLRMLQQFVYEAREETVPVTRKVAETIIDATTKKERVVYKDVTEIQVRTSVIPRPVWQTAISTVDLSLVAATDLAGKPIAEADLRKRCREQTVVVISLDGERVPESYAVLFKPETIVLDVSKLPALAPFGLAPAAPVVDPGEVPIAPAPAPPAPLPPAPAPAPVPARPAGDDPFAPAAPRPAAPAAPARPAVDDPFAPAARPVPAAPAAPAAPAPAFGAPAAPVPGEGPVDAPVDPWLSEFKLPQGSQPTFRLLSIDADNQYVFRSVLKEKATSKRFRKVIEKKVVEGKPVENISYQPIEIQERLETTHWVTFPAEAVTGRTVEQKPFEELHRAALRQREIPVVISQDGEEVDSFWLQNVKPKMLVMVTPSIEPGPSSDGGPMPPLPGGERPTVPPPQPPRPGATELPASPPPAPPRP